jgi:hypothetical protein
MTEATPLASFRDIPKDLLRNRFLQVLVAIAALIEIYNLAVITSYTSTQKAREITAVAENTVMRQEAEANLAEAKAINETQVARYAGRRQAAEARKATAIASKTRYEAEVADATARYAEMRAKAEAEAQQLQAGLISQQEQIQSRLNSYVERRRYAEAEKAEANARISRIISHAAGVTPSRINPAQECNDKFEALWTDFLTVIREASTEWEVERVGAKVQLHKARCGGFTRAQVQRFQRAQKENLADLEKHFCQSPSSYQQKNQQQAAKALGHAPNCRAYTTPLTWRPGNQPATPAPGAGGVTFRVISDAPAGKLNLRGGPGIRHGVLGEMPAGALLRQTGACIRSDDGVTHDPWCKVDWNGTNGWASSSGLEKVQDTAPSQHKDAPEQHASADRAAVQQSGDLRGKVLEFLAAYHKTAAGDMRQLAGYYADTVNYGAKGMTSRAAIMREKMEVAQICPERSYRILEDSVRLQNAGGNRVDVEFDVDTVCGGGAKSTRHVWQNFVSIDFSAPSPRIVAQKGTAK